MCVFRDILSRSKGHNAFDIHMRVVSVYEFVIVREDRKRKDQTEKGGMDCKAQSIYCLQRNPERHTLDRRLDVRKLGNHLES